MDSPDSEPQSTTAADKHLEKLMTYCRVCGKPTARSGGRKLLPVTDFTGIIKYKFNCNVENDVDDIHPPFICQACERMLGRVQKAKNHNKMYPTKLKDIFEFKPHSENCDICGWKTRTTPRKTPRKRDGSSLASGSASTEIPKAKKRLILSEFEEMHIESDRIIESNLAQKIKCVFCDNVTVRGKTYLTGCKHMLCFPCAFKIQDSGTLCPKCMSDSNVLEDLIDVSDMTNIISEQLHVKCNFAENGCTEIHDVKNAKKHENDCLFRKYTKTILTPPRKYTGKPHKFKKPLKNANPGYVKRKRLKSLITSVREYCNDHHENIIDTLFFLLKNELQLKDEHKKVSDLQMIWDSETDNSITALDSLAMRVENLQSKTQYACQYDLLKRQHKILLPTPYQLDKVEDTLMPPVCEYTVTEPEHDVKHHHKPILNPQPVDVTSDFSDGLPESLPPNCEGTRWFYADAIAATLKELDPEVAEGLQQLECTDPNLVLTAIIKDGGDGMGDCSIYKEQSDRKLPDKALRYSFCILEIQVITGENKQTVYQCEHPNSVRSNRPLLEAIADENCKASATVCLVPIEFERSSLQNKMLSVTINDDITRKYELKFFSSMEDEKFDRAFGGLQGAGSSYICTLCYATEASAKENVGKFSIERTLEDTCYLANYIRTNPDNLSQQALANVGKGVKTVPLLMSQPKDRMLDATHADINMARFFKKLIIRLIAQVCQWEETKIVKTQLENAEVKFDKHVKKYIGNIAMLMMPGNYARDFFKVENASVISQLIPDKDDKKHFEMVLEKFREMRSVYRASRPSKSDIDGYKATAVEFACFMKDFFPFARWPNYMHKIVEHVQELLQDKNSIHTIGAMSGEGLEAGNKLFRHIRKNLASKGRVYDGLVGVLKLHWLYSSPTLQRLSFVAHAKYQCGLCGNSGHNRLTCPASDEQSDDQN